MDSCTNSQHLFVTMTLSVSPVSRAGNPVSPPLICPLRQSREKISLTKRKQRFLVAQMKHKDQVPVINHLYFKKTFVRLG